VPGEEPPVSKARAHFLDLRLQRLEARVANRAAAAVAPHRAQAGVEPCRRTVMTRGLLGIERIVGAPRREPAIGDLDLKPRQGAAVEQVEDQGPQVQRLHRRAECRLRLVQHEGQLLLPVALGEQVQAWICFQALPSRARSRSSPTSRSSGRR